MTSEEFKNYSYHPIDNGRSIETLDIIEEGEARRHDAQFDVHVSHNTDGKWCAYATGPFGTDVLAQEVGTTKDEVIESIKKQLFALRHART
jgi:hypothetical protein